MGKSLRRTLYVIVHSAGCSVGIHNAHAVRLMKGLRVRVTRDC